MNPLRSRADPRKRPEVVEIGFVRGQIRAGRSLNGEILRSRSCLVRRRAYDWLASHGFGPVDILSRTRVVGSIKSEDALYDTPRPVAVELAGSPGNSRSLTRRPMC